MPNMNDYLVWRGDLTFDQSGFNEVDGALLVFISYLNMEGIIPEAVGGEGIKLSDAVKTFFDVRNDIKKSYCAIIAGEDIRKMVTLMAKSRRFHDAKLSGYVNRLSYEDQEQFAAFTAEMNDGTVFIAFKGTDDTLVGWKEDFNMASSDEVPCQKSAVLYLKRIGKAFPDSRLRVGGHSKGGNLAVYASAKCDPSVKKRIVRVYNNDGPGFSGGFLQSPEYLEIRDRVLKLVPQESVVGMLLTNDDNFSVISSEKSGVTQHNCYLWQVRGRHFIRRSGLTKQASELSRAVNAWIEDKDMATRRAITDAIYDILTSDNAHTLTDFASDRFLLWKSLARIEPEKRELVFREIRKLIGYLIKSGIAQIPHRAASENEKYLSEKGEK